MSSNPAPATGRPKASKSFELFNGGRKLAWLSALKTSARNSARSASEIFAGEYSGSREIQVHQPRPGQDVTPGIAEPCGRRWKAKHCVLM